MTLAANNHETTKNSLESLRNSAMEMGRAIYQNAGASGAEQQQQQQTQNPESNTNTNEQNKN